MSYEPFKIPYKPGAHFQCYVNYLEGDRFESHPFAV